LSKELLKKGAIHPTAKAVGFLAEKQMKIIVSIFVGYRTKMIWNIHLNIRDLILGLLKA
jgi:hypothetical protein